MSNEPQIAWFEIDWDDRPVGRYLTYRRKPAQDTPDDYGEHEYHIVDFVDNRDIGKDQIWWMSSSLGFHWDVKRENWPSHYALLTPPQVIL